MRKALEGDTVAVLDQMPHRLGQTRNFRHVPPAEPLLRFNTPKLSRLWPVPVKSKTIAPTVLCDASFAPILSQKKAKRRWEAVMGKLTQSYVYGTPDRPL